MNDLLQILLKLQALDFADPPPKNAEADKAGLRKRVPEPILGHYDRLVARGKKGVAVVRNQVCTGCHMRLPIGTINTVMQGQDIQICDSCGRYLCLEPAVEPAAEQPVAEPSKAARKPARKPRKRKVAANAAA
jgi:hypothetical protein